MKKKYDIFISYRRDGGEYTARILRDKLSNLGYRVFFDVESLRSGDFNTELYKVIDECEDFLLVLSPGALDRCENEDDWVRQEVVHALQKEKNIVPVMLRNFEFPEQMPEEIEPLRYKNGLPADAQFFDAFIEKLEGFLSTKPRKILRWKRVLPVVIAIAFILCAALGVVAWNYSSLFPYPRTATEKNLTENLLQHIETNLQQIEMMAECMDKAYETGERQLAYEESGAENFSQTMRQYRSTLYQMDLTGAELSQDLKNAMQDSPFSVADAAALYQLTQSYQKEFLDDIYNIEYLILHKSLMDKSVKKELLDSYRGLLDENLKMMAACTNEMLLPVKNESAMEEFKQEFLPMLRYIPLAASNWSDDENALKSDEKKYNDNMQKIFNDILSVLGTTNIEVIEEKSKYIELLMSMGDTLDEAEKKAEAIITQSHQESEQLAALQEKIKELEKTEEQLAQTEEEFAQKKEEISKEFAPTDGDDTDTLWTKMMGFLNMAMYDDAIVCVDAYREAARSENRAETQYAEQVAAAATRFIRNISNTGIDYGVMVVNYESGQDKNDPRKIGDVIISVNGKPCHNYEEYSALRQEISDTESSTIVVLRDSGDGKGTLKQVEVTLPAGIQRVYVYSMTEKTYE